MPRYAECRDRCAAALRRGAGDHDPRRPPAWRSPLPVQAAGLDCTWVSSPWSCRRHLATLARCSLMVIAGIAWGLYSLRGRGNARPMATTAGNCLRPAVPAVCAIVMDRSGSGIRPELPTPRSRATPPAWGRSGTRRCRTCVRRRPQPWSSRASVDGGGRGLPARGDADAATRALFRGGAEWHRLDPHNALGARLPG